MSHPVLPFTTPAALESSLLRAPPDTIPTIPSVDELVKAQHELVQLKAKTLERAKKAENDLKTIEVAFRKMREVLEKGKVKSSAKIKREPSCE